MRVRVLGTAAGGGLPQWNCNCDNCAGARSGQISPRFQAAIAFSAGRDWYLLNATPDLPLQLAAWPQLYLGRNLRESPLKGVILSDLELDHTWGLLHLREGTGWQLLAPPGILAGLARHLPVKEILKNYVQIEEIPLAAEKPYLIRDPAGSVELTLFPTGTHAPKYSSGKKGEVYGVQLHNPESGQTLIYAPGVEQIDASLGNWLSNAQVIMFDGTCYQADELIRLGISRQTSLDMGHVPMAVSAPFLSPLPGKKLYIHINNTNPVLDPQSRERAELTKLGLGIAADRDEYQL